MIEYIVLPVLILIIALISLLESKHRFKYAAIVTVIAIALSCWSGCDKIEKENKAGKDADSLKSKINNLTLTVDKLAKSKEADSLRTAEFEKKLFESFNIIRDSQNNPKVYNNTVIKPRDVYFDQR